MRTPLFSRNFLFLILGQVSSLIGNFTLKFALSMYILEQTGSASIFAGITALSLLPMILMSPFGGILADRADRRKIMVALDTLSGITVLIGCIALRWNDLAVIFALLIILSVLGAFESPAVQACIPQMLSGDNILRGNAIVSQVQAGASLIAPFSGSIFYTAFGIRPVLWGTVLCFFVTALLECFIRLERRKTQSSQSIRAIVKKDLSASMHFLFREEPSVSRLLLLAALVSMFLTGILVVGFPYLVRTILGLSAEHYGFAESAMGVAGIAGGAVITFLAQRIRSRHLVLFIMAAGICLIPAGIAFLLPLEASGIYTVLLVMFCGCQLICSMFSVYSISLIQQRTPKHLTGKVMSCVYTLSLCAQPLGQLLYGALFDLCSGSVYWILIPSGALICITGLAASGFLRDLSLPEGR